jgi:hypothetical protein
MLESEGLVPVGCVGVDFDLENQPGHDLATREFAGPALCISTCLTCFRFIFDQSCF